MVLNYGTLKSEKDGYRHTVENVIEGRVWIEERLQPLGAGPRVVDLVGNQSEIRFAGIGLSCLS